MKKYPPKWQDVYRKDSNEEFKFWIALSRNRKWTWRSTAAIAAEAGISEIYCEELLMTYYNLGMVLQDPNNFDQWGYWEQHIDLVPQEPLSLKELDKAFKLKKAVEKN